MATKNTVVIWLTRIIGSGESVGRDTTFEITAGGETTTITSDIAAGQSQVYHQVVLQQATSGSSAAVTISIKVTEKDETPDEGTMSKSYDIERADGRTALSPIVVQVKEKEKNKKKGPVGYYTFFFEADFTTSGGLGRRHVAIEKGGWLLAKDDKGKDWSLPWLLDVEVTKIEGGREYFTALEGVYSGRKGSVSLRNGLSAFSADPITRRPAAVIRYVIEGTFGGERHIEVDGVGNFEVVDPPKNDFSGGEVYDVQIPDDPHRGGQSYLAQAAFATSWFRVGSQPLNRYLHTGRASAGCATVNEIGRWDQLWRALINSRKDSRHIGTLTVIRK